jgi:hypothetical protein
VRGVVVRWVEMGMVGCLLGTVGVADVPVKVRIVNDGK